MPVKLPRCIVFEKKPKMNKKTIALCSLISFFGLVASPLSADHDDFISIEVGGPKVTSKKRLAKRVRLLEGAVLHLQDRLYRLETASTSATPMTTCYIQTPFDGTFTATRPTRTAAKGDVMRQCTKKADETWCREKKVKCGK